MKNIRNGLENILRKVWEMDCMEHQRIENGVETNFKVMGKSDKKTKKRKKKLNGKRNRIEGDFGTLKEHFKMNKN